MEVEVERYHSLEFEAEAPIDACKDCELQVNPKGVLFQKRGVNGSSSLEATLQTCTNMAWHSQLHFPFGRGLQSLIGFKSF